MASSSRLSSNGSERLCVDAVHADTARYEARLNIGEEAS